MSKDKREGWIATLEEGDEVIYEYNASYRSGEGKSTTITRITPTGIIRTESNRSYNPNGRERGTNYHRGTRLKPATEKALRHIDLTKKRCAVKARIARNMDKVTDEKVEAIHEILFGEDDGE